MEGPFEAKKHLGIFASTGAEPGSEQLKTLTQITTQEFIDFLNGVHPKYRCNFCDTDSFWITSFEYMGGKHPQALETQVLPYQGESKFQYFFVCKHCGNTKYFDTQVVVKAIRDKKDAKDERV